MSRVVTASATGKLMIMGEHAVVYGAPCIVTAVDKRISVTVERTNSGIIEFVTPESKDTRFLEAAVSEAQKTWKFSHTGLLISSKSDFSSSYGFGSSSAVTVACIRALTQAFSINVSNYEVFTASYNAVIDVQQVGSGFDVASAVYGGTILYVKGGSRIETLKNIPELVVGYTGVKADTATIVKNVKQKYDQYKPSMDRIFTAIGQLVEKAKIAWDQNDWETVGKLMYFNQEYLRDLGVSTEKLESLIMAAKHAGALGAKLSGAGGGDCMIALVTRSSKSAVEDAIIKAGGKVLHVGIHAQCDSDKTTDDQEEIFIVVDEKDVIVGYKTRYECHHDKNLIHRTVGVAVFNTDGKVLLQKRSLTKDMDAGKWGMSCAGHVIKGESYEQSAARELEEELGINTPLTQGKKFLSKDEHETEIAMIYTTISNGPFHIDTNETSEVKFFTKSDIIRMLLSDHTAITQGTIDGLKAIQFI